MIVRAIAIGFALLAPPTIAGTVLLNVLDASELAVGLFLLGLVVVGSITSGVIAKRTESRVGRDHSAQPQP